MKKILMTVFAGFLSLGMYSVATASSSKPQRNENDGQPKELSAYTELTQDLVGDTEGKGRNGVIEKVLEVSKNNGTYTIENPGDTERSILKNIFSTKGGYAESNVFVLWKKYAPTIKLTVRNMSSLIWLMTHQRKDETSKRRIITNQGQVNTVAVLKVTIRDGLKALAGDKALNRQGRIKAMGEDIRTSTSATVRIANVLKTLSEKDGAELVQFLTPPKTIEINDENYTKVSEDFKTEVLKIKYLLAKMVALETYEDGMKVKHGQTRKTSLTRVRAMKTEQENLCDILKGTILTFLKKEVVNGNTDAVVKLAAMAWVASIDDLDGNYFLSPEVFSNAIIKAERDATLLNTGNDDSSSGAKAFYSSRKDYFEKYFKRINEVIKSLALGIDAEDAGRKEALSRFYGGEDRWKANFKQEKNLEALYIDEKYLKE